MTLDELAGHWDAEAEDNEERAKETRSLDMYARLQAQAQQLRWCAAQLRLVTRPPVIVKCDGELTEEQVAEVRAALDRAVKDGKPPPAGPEGARELLAFARSVTWTWAVVGVAVALPVALLARTPWGACALAPWAICQAVEWVLGRRLARPPS